MKDVVDAMMRWWPVPFLAFQGVMAWIWWSLDKRFIPSTTYEKDQKEVGNRIAELERGVYTAPTRPEISALTAQLQSLGQKLSHLDGRLTGVNRAVDLLNQHHLNKGNGG